MNGILAHYVGTRFSVGGRYKSTHTRPFNKSSTRKDTQKKKQLSALRIDHILIPF